MSTSFRTLLALLISAAALSPTSSLAQQRCSEGRTAAGECVNPLLAARMRQTAIIFSQPKISQTAYPVLPAADRLFRYPNQVISEPFRVAPCCGAPIP